MDFEETKWRWHLCSKNQPSIESIWKKSAKLERMNYLESWNGNENIIFNFVYKYSISLIFINKYRTTVSKLGIGLSPTSQKNGKNSAENGSFGIAKHRKILLIFRCTFWCALLADSTSNYRWNKLKRIGVAGRNWWRAAGARPAHRVVCVCWPTLKNHTASNKSHKITKSISLHVELFRAQAKREKTWQKSNGYTWWSLINGGSEKLTNSDAARRPVRLRFSPPKIAVSDERVQKRPLFRLALKWNRCDVGKWSKTALKRRLQSTNASPAPRLAPASAV